MNNLLTNALSYLITAAIGATIAWLLKLKKELASTKNGVEALLHNKIIEMFNHYQKKGYIPIYARESIERMHGAYQTLGGNGTFKVLMSKLHNMPTDEKKETKQ